MNELKVSNTALLIQPQRKDGPVRAEEIVNLMRELGNISIPVGKFMSTEGDHYALRIVVNGKPLFEIKLIP